MSGEADTDIFISLKSDTPQDLKTIFDSLATKLQQSNYPVSKRTVAIQTSSNGQKIDLVPGKQQSGFLNWHSLYNSDSGNWLQTNIDEHINSVKNSGRLDEIRAMKIACNNHQFKFSSIYLELIIFEALYNKNKGQLAMNVRTILEYLRDKFVDKRIEDTSNSNNILSEYLLKKYQKEAIAKKAGECLREPYWEQIIWYYNKRTHNRRSAKAGVSSFYDSEVINSSFVHLMKFSAEPPPSPSAKTLYPHFKTD